MISNRPRRELVTLVLALLLCSCSTTVKATNTRAGSGKQPSAAPGGSAASPTAAAKTAGRAGRAARSNRAKTRSGLRRSSFVEASWSLLVGGMSYAAAILDLDVKLLAAGKVSRLKVARRAQVLTAFSRAYTRYALELGRLGGLATSRTLAVHRAAKQLKSAAGAVRCLATRCRPAADTGPAIAGLKRQVAGLATGPGRMSRPGSSIVTATAGHLQTLYGLGAAAEVLGHRALALLLSARKHKLLTAADSGGRARGLALRLGWSLGQYVQIRRELPAQRGYLQWYLYHTALLRRAALAAGGGKPSKGAPERWLRKAGSSIRKANKDVVKALDG